MDSLRDLGFEVQYREGVTNGNAEDESLREGKVLGSPEDDYVEFAA